MSNKINSSDQSAKIELEGIDRGKPKDKLIYFLFLRINQETILIYFVPINIMLFI